VWLRDPDGYLVVLASPDGESPWPDRPSAQSQCVIRYERTFLRPLLP
jgi:hypothetical protein